MAGRHYQINATSAGLEPVNPVWWRQKFKIDPVRKNMPCRLQPPGGSNTRVCGWLCFTPTGAWFKNKQKQINKTKLPPTGHASLCCVFLGLLLLQMPVRAGGCQEVMFSEFYAVTYALRWRPRTSNAWKTPGDQGDSATDWLVSLPSL